MKLEVKTRDSSYPIFLEEGELSRVGNRFFLDRKCMIVTDENIPKQYIDAVKGACKEPFVHTVLPGEGSKCLAVWEEILGKMVSLGFTRSDCVIAVGGGVVGDLAGFVASSFLRGVDFFNIPTTLLSQVDSSIGGKVGVNFMGMKNLLGAFYPPKAVLIDPKTLSSLPKRELRQGMAEAVKMAATSDEELFCLLEEDGVWERLPLVIEKSLGIKKSVVEEDERESGKRRILNFGHTLAHGVEAESLKGERPLFHGECVALGMLPMCSEEVRGRVKAVLEKLGLETRFPFSIERIFSHMEHDKKRLGDDLVCVFVDKIGSYRIEKMPVSQFKEELKGRIE